jgi:hypothetical protein
MKTLGGIPGLIVPILSCVIVFFLFTSICIHSFLESAEHDAYGSRYYHDNKDERDLSTLYGHDRRVRRHRRKPPSKVAAPDASKGQRSSYEARTALSVSEIQARVETTLTRSQRPPLETVHENIGYDVHRCPPEIPLHYPYAWNIVDILTAWNPDDTQIPSKIHQGLCSIDWSDTEQQDIAKTYQQHEVPFLVKNHPEIWKAAERWSHVDYVQSLLGEKAYRNEHSLNNHMMYWKLRKRGTGNKPAGWEPPTEDVDLSFADWYAKATALENESDPVHAEHFYLRLNGVPDGQGEFLYDELPFFLPTPEAEGSIFMVEPNMARGINCRLGSKGIIAEMHYDSSRNFILLLGGQKRYILAHPDQCVNVELFPMGHPSARHSAVNWSDPDSWVDENHKHFRNAQANEVVLQAGDGLYLPTAWMHFIVSLSMNYQCNARSGTTHEYDRHIEACGFPTV